MGSHRHRVALLPARLCPSVDGVLGDLRKLRVQVLVGIWCGGRGSGDFARAVGAGQPPQALLCGQAVCARLEAPQHRA